MSDCKIQVNSQALPNLITTQLLSPQFIA
jgi:hypothetical protein